MDKMKVSANIRGMTAAFRGIRGSFSACRKPMLAAAALLASITAFAAPTDNRQNVGTFMLSGWQTLRMRDTKVEVSGGRSHLRDTSGVFECKADSIRVSLKPLEKGRKLDLKNTVESADLQGDVWLAHRPKKGQMIEARSSKAHIDWIGKVARLEGNVEIIQIDPELFAAPSRLKGDSAIILLKKDLGPDEYRITVQSNTDRSRIEVTPKPKQ